MESVTSQCCYPRAARFEKDDGYAVGPPSVVFDTMARFAADVTEFGLQLRIDKSKCFSFGNDLANHPGRPRSMPLGFVENANIFKIIKYIFFGFCTAVGVVNGFVQHLQLSSLCSFENAR